MFTSDLSKIYEQENKTIVNMAIKTTAGLYSMFEHNMDVATRTSKQLYAHANELADLQRNVYQHMFESCRQFDN